MKLKTKTAHSDSIQSILNRGRKAPILSHMKTLIIDIEVFPNLFMVCFMDVEDRANTLTVKMQPGEQIKAGLLRKIMIGNRTVSFNGLAYDLPVLAAALSGMDNKALHALSGKLVAAKQPWAVIRSAGLVIPEWNNHVDLIGLAPGQASLKLYGGRLGADTLRDLPFDPDTELSPEQAAIVEEYCLNDLNLTADLFQALLPQIELRERMGEQDGLNLVSKSDAQIAEMVLRHELQAQGVNVFRPEGIEPGFSFQYQPPAWISFNDPGLQALLQTARETVFQVGQGGKVNLPEALARKINYAGRLYSIGIGGLHSNETGLTVRADEQHALFDADFASFYPSIILGEGYHPQHLGKRFLAVYRAIVTRRLEAKAKGDMVTANSLKIVVNASFGKFGSPYSFLHSPQLLIGVTLTGQLSLLMLIERVTRAGGQVISANTDGIVIFTQKDQLPGIREALFSFELDSGFTLVETPYRAIFIESVNNYLAIKPDGSVKGKGAYAPGSLSKNPTFPVCAAAVREWAAKGTDVADFIRNCTDIRQFSAVRRVTGGAVWQGKPLGKVVRWYVSNSRDAAPLLYAKNANKVPRTDQARPMMTLCKGLPEDLDMNFYTLEARKMLKRIGSAQCQKSMLNKPW
jgi:hypothetical protein